MIILDIIEPKEDSAKEAEDKKKLEAAKEYYRLQLELEVIPLPPEESD